MLSIGGLKKPTIKKGLGAAGPAKKAAKPSAFAAGSDDEDSNLPIASGSRVKPAVQVNAPLSRAEKQRVKEAEALDATVYEYDEVYDNMKAGERQVELDRKKESQERKPRYIEGLLKTAEQRKNDRVRAEDIMTQREREKEGTEFADKDAFVTPAYLAQQEELRKAEEEEAKREAAQAAKKGQGMASFFKDYLANNEARNEAAMKAASNKAAPGAIQQPQVYDEEPVSDVQLAREAAQKTGNLVEINEDGRVVDKTELLEGGLNVARKKPVQGPSVPVAGSGFAVPISQREADEKKAEAEKPANAFLSKADVARKRAMRERQSRELEAQMIESNDKKRKQEEEERAQGVAKLAKRNDETKLEELKRLAAERRAARAKAGDQ